MQNGSRRSHLPISLLFKPKKLLPLISRKSRKRIEAAIQPDEKIRRVLVSQKGEYQVPAKMPGTIGRSSACQNHGWHNVQIVVVDPGWGEPGWDGCFVRARVEELAAHPGNPRATSRSSPFLAVQHRPNHREVSKEGGEPGAARLISLQGGLVDLCESLEEKRGNFVASHPDGEDERGRCDLDIPVEKQLATVPGLGKLPRGGIPMVRRATILKLSFTMAMNRGSILELFMLGSVHRRSHEACEIGPHGTCRWWKCTSPAIP